MAKEIVRIAKLQFIAGKAKPGAELASVGINMPQFCTAFNAQTKDMNNDVIPTVITVYSDKSFEFVTKTVPATNMIFKKLNIKKGSGTPNKEKVGKITIEQLKEIAEYKMVDLNATSIEAAIRIIAGSAKSLGIEIDGELPDIKKSLNEGEDNV